MRRLPAILIIGITLLALAIILPLTLTGGHHARRTPEQLNGHQTRAQKLAKTRAAVGDLKTIARPHSPSFRARVCDRLPEGIGHMGVCAKAPAYGPKGIAPATLGAAVLSGALGIDTSHWDHCGGSLAGPRYWIVAVGDGTYIDPCAGPLYASLRRAGLPRTTYYFTRQYLSPIWSADHYAGLIRQMGATDSLVPDDDAEAISSCTWIYTFDNRLKADLHLRRIMDYSSPGLWSGCNGNGNAAHTAAYGPIGQRLSGGGWVSYVMQQTSDGHVGPYPHCVAVCGDIDLATSSFAPILVKPPPPPVTAAQTGQCGTLRYWRSHGYGSRPDTGDLRNSLVANRVACPDHAAVRTGPPPNPPQPSPAQFRQCRELLWWRAHGRPADQRAHEQSDRAQLTGLHVRCNGRPPLTAVHGS